MGTWDLRRLQHSLSKHSPSPLYLLFGEESYLVSKALSLIQSKSVADEFKDFNVDHFDALQASPSQVKDTVATLPVMASQRLVIFRNVQKLKESDWEQLASLIEDPVDSCVFVLMAEKVDKRKKYFKKLNRHGTCIELKAPYDNQIPMWIDYIAADAKVQINKEAKSLLHQLVGVDLSEIKNEISKIKSYLGDRSHIDEKDVLKVVSRSRVHSIFDLTDAIGQKDVPRAFMLLAKLLERGESEVAILSLILRHIRILGLIHKAQSEGLTGQSLSSMVGVSPFFLGQYQQQSRFWDRHQIKDTIGCLHETDRALKSSPVSSRIWLENFIVKSCQ